MKILLHTCCAPCTIYPLDSLRQSGFTAMGFFYRHNIHPFTECMKREAALREYAAAVDMKVIFQQDYDLEGFLRKMVFREADRCRICYYERLYTTAKLAKKGRFDCFSSTLLFSRHQDHALIAEIGAAAGKAAGIGFHYADFRTGWEAGRDKSIAMQMYRQQYCGCIYSEKERYYPRQKKTP